MSRAGYTVEVRTSSLLVGPAAAFQPSGSVTTIKLPSPTEQELELLNLFKSCLTLTGCLQAGLEERVSALLERMDVLPAMADTPQEYRIVSKFLPFPIEIFLRPRTAGG